MRLFFRPWAKPPSRCLRDLPAHIRRDIGLPPGLARSTHPLAPLW